MLGDELITNGEFTGNANNWEIAGTQWSYNSNNLISDGDREKNSQTYNIPSSPVTITAGKTYRISINVGGDPNTGTGNISLFCYPILGDDSIAIINEGYGLYSIDVVALYDGILSSIDHQFKIQCSSGFVGTIDDVSVKENLNSSVPPVSNFSATPLSGIVPLEIQFTDESTNTPTSWLWSFGDSQTSTEQSPTHIYQNTGIYTVSLTATNADGSDTETKIGYVEVSGYIPPTPSTSPFNIRSIQINGHYVGHECTPIVNNPDNLGPELITNGDFDGSANNWNLEGFEYGNKNIVVGNYTDYVWAISDVGISLEAGKTYEVSIEIGGNEGTVDLEFTEVL